MENKETITLEREMLEALVRAYLKIESPTFDSEVKYGATKFKYASLGELYNKSRKALLEEGFATVHTIIWEDEIAWIKTYLQYVNGLKFGECKYPLSITNKEMQKVGSQITYIKRYSLSAILAVVAEEDDDAHSIKDDKLNEALSPKKPNLISEAEANYVKELIDGDKEAWKTISERFGYNKISSIHQNKYQSILAALNIYNTNKAQQAKDGE